ncbi:MAG: hypothetical protein MJ061_05975, partial [Mailhella sp.]|nr:hypothetical protein [Mailhella sp.]
VRYGDETGRRPHFMMPRTGKGPRPYPLEALKEWEALRPLFSDAGTQSQRKTALELLARLHADWDCADPAFGPMAADILANTMAGGDAQPMPLELAADGTLFDLFEWYDFLANA